MAVDLAYFQEVTDCKIQKVNFEISNDVKCC